MNHKGLGTRIHERFRKAGGVDLPTSARIPLTQAESHDRWVREQVRRGLDDTRPGKPHDDVMAEMSRIIGSAERK